MNEHVTLHGSAIRGASDPKDLDVAYFGEWTDTEIWTFVKMWLKLNRPELQHLPLDIHKAARVPSYRDLYPGVDYITIAGEDPGYCLSYTTGAALRLAAERGASPEFLREMGAGVYCVYLEGEGNGGYATDAPEAVRAGLRKLNARQTAAFLDGMPSGLIPLFNAVVVEGRALRSDIIAEIRGGCSGGCARLFGSKDGSGYRDMYTKRRWALGEVLA